MKQRRFLASLSAIIILWWLGVSTCWATTVTIRGMRVSGAGVNTRLVLDVNAPPKFVLFSLTNPDRIVLDIKDAKFIGALPSISGSIIRGMRTHPHDKGYFRIVIDLRQKVQPKSFLLQPKTLDKKDYRLVIDFTKSPSTTMIELPKARLLDTHTKNAKNASEKSAKTKINKNTKLVSKQKLLVLPAPEQLTPVKKPIKTVIVAQKPPMKKTAAKKTPMSTPPSEPIPLLTDAPNFPAHKGRPIIIVIDPGHGGKDPGTTGPGGTHEKDVVLAVSKQLQILINAEPGFHAELTRTGDYFIPLRGRLTIARKDKADMFVAIHADAFNNDTALGASVFALSERGATSEAARWLAEKENSSELLGGATLPTQDNILRSVLIDLSQTNTISESLQIGTSVLQQISKVSLLHHARVEQAAFVVLKSPDIPSILVETGFLSTPQQERQLRNPQYQHKIAMAIMLGIKSYFMGNPPPGTLLAADKPNRY